MNGYACLKLTLSGGEVISARSILERKLLELFRFDTIPENIKKMLKKSHPARRQHMDGRCS